MFNGKKTFIMAILGIITLGLYLLGVIDETTMLSLLALWGFGGLAMLRLAIKDLITVKPKQ